MEDTTFIEMEETPDEHAIVICPESEKEITEKETENMRQVENGTDNPKMDAGRKLPPKKLSVQFSADNDNAATSLYFPRNSNGSLKIQGDKEESIRQKSIKSPKEKKQHLFFKKRKDSNTSESNKKCMDSFPLLNHTSKNSDSVNLPPLIGFYRKKDEGDLQTEVVDDERIQSLPTPHLDIVAHDLVEAIQWNNLNKVESILVDHSDLNLYLHVDAKGISAVEQAVETGIPTLVGTLIGKSPFPDERNDLIKHALNVSIKRNDINMVKHLLDMKRPCPAPSADSPNENSQHQSLLISTMAKRKASRFQDATFSVSISPMILAAQLERQEIIEMLLRYGESDIHPITAERHCTMSDCIMNFCNRVPAGLSTIEQSHSMLQTYSAISSPAFIFNSGVQDPLFEAFSICAEMEQLQSDDPAFRYEYKSIQKKCKFFAMDLVNLCRSTEEMDVLLQCELSARGEPKIPCCRPIHHSRIQMALSYKQTEFVTHPHVQKFLQKAWYEGCPKFVLRRQNSRLKLLYLLLFLLLYPILVPTYMFQCCPYVNTLLKTAVLKFVAHSTSYIFFLVVLVSAAVHDLDITSSTEISPQHWAHFVLIASWIIGFALRHLNSTPHERCFTTTSGVNFKEVFGGSRFYDTMIIILFIFAMILHLVVLVDGFSEREDIVPVAASFYALGALGAFFRICTLMKESSTLGPLYISFKSMLFDILKFAVLILVILTAFVVAHMHLIRFDSITDSAQSENNTNGIHSGARINIGSNNETSHLGTVLRSRTVAFYRGYLWALLGYGEMENGRVTFEGHQNETIGLSDVGPMSAGAEFQVIVSKILLYSYLIVVTIALLNMLIAMMSNTFSRIEDNCDTEWKFARSRLRMAYFNNYGVLPPPFNIIPIPYIIKACKCAVRRKPLRPISRSSSTVTKEFTELMENLSKRYWQKKSNNADQADRRKGSKKQSRRESSGTIYSII